MATAAQAGSKVIILILSTTFVMLVTSVLSESHPKDDSMELKEKIEMAEVESFVSYTSDQASRGKKKYEKNCAECHGKDFKGGMNGGPPLRGVGFLEKYANGAPASFIFEFMIYMMPPDSPGRFSPKTYTDIMAYILKKNGFKSGALLPSDVDALEKLTMKK